MLQNKNTLFHTNMPHSESITQESFVCLPLTHLISDYHTMQSSSLHITQTKLNLQTFTHLASKIFQSTCGFGVPTYKHASLTSTRQATLKVCPNEITAAGTDELGANLMTGVLGPCPIRVDAVIQASYDSLVFKSFAS